MSRRHTALVERSDLASRLALAEQRLERAERMAHLGCWDWDLRTNTLEWTDEVWRISGRLPGSAALTPAWIGSLCHPDDRAYVDSTVRRALATGEAYRVEYRMVLPNGRARWRAVEGEVTRDAGGRPIRLSGTVQDIHARKIREVWVRAERDILARIAARADLRGTLEAIAELVEDRAMGMLGSILLLDDEGCVHVAAAPSLPEAYNRAVEGARIGPVAGSCGTAAWRGETVVTPDIATDPLWVAYRDVALAAGLASSWSTPLFASDGSVVGSLALYYTHPQDPRPEDEQAVVIARQLAEIAIERDRTDSSLQSAREELERRVAERTAALEQAQRANRELEAFSSAVSHDLRAPLRSIEAFSALVEEGYAAALDDQGRRYLSAVRRGAARMTTLIEDLLRLSRISRLEVHRERVDLGVIAREVVEALRLSSPGREVRVTIAPDLYTDADPHLLHVVLENLVGNAWKYTSQHSTAAITIGATEACGRRVWFVRDDGAGFDMGTAQHLFEPFHRLHPTSQFEGTGVGLATVQRIIERHGGRIWAEAEVERGATFYFTLGERALEPA